MHWNIYKTYIVYSCIFFKFHILYLYLLLKIITPQKSSPHGFENGRFWGVNAKILGGAVRRVNVVNCGFFLEELEIVSFLWWYISVERNHQKSTFWQQVGELFLCTSIQFWFSKSMILGHTGTKKVLKSTVADDSLLCLIGDENHLSFHKIYTLTVKVFSSLENWSSSIEVSMIIFQKQFNILLVSLREPEHVSWTSCVVHAVATIFFTQKGVVSSFVAWGTRMIPWRKCQPSLLG